MYGPKKLKKCLQLGEISHLVRLPFCVSSPMSLLRSTAATVNVRTQEAKEVLAVGRDLTPCAFAFLCVLPDVTVTVNRRDR